MKVLSIRQPWAWAILHAGKPIENRSWWTNYRGPALIHAAKGMTRAEFAEASDFILRVTEGVCWAPKTLPRGGIVGMAEIVDCVVASDSPWFFGPFGFVLENCKPLPFQPCKGKLGFFDVPPEVCV